MYYEANTTERSIKTLVVDGSVTYRKALAELLDNFAHMQCTATAGTVSVARAKMNVQPVEMVIIDCDMILGDGLVFMEELEQRFGYAGVILLADPKRMHEKEIIEAMDLGAFDLICKPKAESYVQIKTELSETLYPVLKAFSRMLNVKNILKHHPRQAATDHSSAAEKTSVPPPHCSEPKKLRQSQPPPEIVAVGISTGGPRALSQVLPALPGDLPVPIVIVQHMPTDFTASLADNLDQKCILPVLHARHGQILQPGKIYIAPGGRQMKIEQIKNRKVIQVTDDPPENSCKPSADYLFRSVARGYGPASVGVIMTGMGCDGRAGMVEMKRNGALIIAQDESSCTVFGMPREVIQAGLADKIVPSNRIAAEIVKAVCPAYTVKLIG